MLPINKKLILIILFFICHTSWSQSIHEIRLLENIVEKMDDQTPSSFLKNYIKSKYKFDISLKEISAKNSKMGNHYTYVQTYQGVTIHNTFIKLNISKNQEILSIIIDGYDTRDWKIEALKIPQEFENQIFYKKEIMIAMKDDKPQMILRALHFQTKPLVCEEWLIDQQGVYEKNNKITYLRDTNIQVKVFNPDPLTTAKKYYGAPYLDRNDSNYAEIQNELKTFTIGASFDTITKKFVLAKGTKKVVDYAGTPVNNVPQNISDSFYYNRSMKEFESVNIYYHVSKMESFIKSLGLNDLDAALLFLDGHGKEDDNSAYLEEPNPQVILYGDGGVDDAEDADVIVHEYMHYVGGQASPISNSGFERNALDEGLADYFACSYSKEISEFRWQDMFTWDGHNEFWKGRQMNNLKIYPDSILKNDIHNTGAIWAGMMTNINIALGRKITDALQLNSMYNYFPNMTFYDAATFLLQAEKLLFNEKYKCIVQKNLRERGLASPELNVACYDPSVAFEANFTSKSICKNEKSTIGVSPENLIVKDNTYYWYPSNNLSDYKSSNPIYTSDKNFTYQLTICNNEGKCNAKNITITTTNCHLVIDLYNSYNFINGKEDLIIRLPDDDETLLGYSIQVFTDQGQLIINRPLPSTYFSSFKVSELPEVKGIYFVKIIKTLNKKELLSKIIRVAKF